ncbi:PIG-L deacetylase family protein [Peptoniphilus porci]|uniref:LmbE family protein n=1 Tax=Peptoniphilus porci TaxID=2652280 RepID=A0A1U7M0U6_9FIRM|nr:PIG-L deacetylase family protein [Peptoniphilus porci]OLR65228.1 LmbE family protein [Peptoniphilus porci]
MKSNKNLLVVSAHAADYVWRSGGTIARYIDEGANVSVLVLSYGTRGESNDLWRKEGISYEEVKEIRKSETEKAASILGVKDIEFWDLEDYPMVLGRKEQDKLAKIIRQKRPDTIITHGEYDYLNPDHNDVYDFVLRSSIMANSRGVQIEGLEVTKQMRLLGFEPHQTEMSNFKPDVIVDITDAFEKKVKAMECFKAQGHLIEYYKQRAIMRGNHARRVSGNSDYQYAETFCTHFPLVIDILD